MRAALAMVVFYSELHVVPRPDGSLAVSNDCPKGNLKSRAVWVVKLAPSKGLSVSRTVARPIRPRSVR